MVLQIKLVIDVVGFSYNARPAIIRVWIFDIQTAFFVTRGGVQASGVVIMSIINCVEPSYEPGEEVARLLP